MRATLLGIFLVPALLSGTAATAQGIYKQTDDSGRTIFTDQPNAAARTVARYYAEPTAYLVQQAQPGQPGQNSPSGQNASSGAQGDTAGPGGDVELALDTMTQMSSPRSALIDAREAGVRARRVEHATSGPNLGNLKAVERLVPATYQGRGYFSRERPVDQVYAPDWKFNLALAAYALLVLGAVYAGALFVIRHFMGGSIHFDWLPRLRSLIERATH